MSKFKSGLNNIIIIVMLFLLSGLITRLTVLEKQPSFITYGFLVNYLGVFLGIVITLITFIYSVIKQIMNDDKEAGGIYSELKDDTYFIFWMFIIALLIMAFSSIDIPYVTLNGIYINKVVIFDFVKN